MSRSRSWIVCIVVYAVAWWAADLVMGISGAPLIPRTFLADAMATAVVFAASVAFNNSSLYDPYWSVAPPVIVLAWARHATGGLATRQWLIIGLVLLWALRLTGNWLYGWAGLSHEDWRYRRLARQTGGAYWFVSLTGIHYMPTVLVFLACWPLAAALASPAPLGPIDVLATLVTATGIGLEAEADRQLHRFKRWKKGPGDRLKTGLWAWHDHPNYVGEMTFWWGLWLFALATLPFSQAYTRAAGAVLITALFVFISIPMMDGRVARRTR